MSIFRRREAANSSSAKLSLVRVCFPPWVKMPPAPPASSGGRLDLVQAIYFFHFIRERRPYGGSFVKSHVPKVLSEFADVNIGPRIGADITISAHHVFAGLIAAQVILARFFPYREPLLKREFPINASRNGGISMAPVFFSVTPIALSHA